MTPSRGMLTRVSRGRQRSLEEMGSATRRRECRPVVQGAQVAPQKASRAQEMRAAPTPAEALAWDLLRGRKICGLKFRRQQVIQGFIVDF